LTIWHCILSAELTKKKALLHRLAILPTGRIDNYEEINMLPVLDYLSSAMQAIHE